jgi:hypothetical protein
VDHSRQTNAQNCQAIVQRNFMIESARLDRLLTQVNCHISSIARLRDAGTISQRKAKQELKQAVDFRADLMRQIDSQNFVSDA